MKERLIDFTMTMTIKHVIFLVLSLLSLCIHTQAQECTVDGECDTHERCSVWKEEGECLRNAAYMAEFCPASCVDVELSTGGECKDLHPRCTVWADLGECEDNESEMNRFCPEACEVCPEDLAAAGSEEDELCVDNHVSCEYWTGLGECKSNKRWMQTNCAKSCEMCETFKPRARRMTKQKNDGSDILAMSEDFGVRQNAEGTQMEETLAVIKDSIEYMKGALTASLSEEVFENCMNRNVLCAFWSVIGECENNKAYMATNCAPSCMTCHMLDIQTRCPPLEDVDPVFHPGDLNKMFERIVRTAPANRTLNDKEKEPLESGMTDYAVVVHSQPSSEAATEVSAVLDSSLPPWVITLENFLTPEECDAMIELGYKYGYERSEDVGALKFDGTHEGVQNDRRTSENAWCSTFQGCRQQEIPMLIHERMAKVMQIPVNNSEDLQVLRYEEGQFYRTHHDYIQHHAERHCGVRILTFFLYLSDVEAGGGTNFPQLDMTIHPKKGRALLWPSVLDSDPSKIDKRMYHQALPVEEGVKYAANGWIHPFDYVTPQAAGCN